jgi:hypothetical protein
MMQWESKMADLIPPHMHDGLTLWIEHGVMTGDFMTALMKNDLMEAMGRADEINARCIRNWCVYLYSYAPRGCYGGPIQVAAWRQHKGLSGILPKEDRPDVA